MRLTADYAKAIRSIFIEVADDLTRSLGGKSFGEEKMAHRAPAVDEAV